MVRLAILVVLSTAALAANYTSVFFKQSGACVHATFELSGAAGSTRMFLDEDSETSDGIRTRSYSNSQSRGNLQICGLREATTYYLKIDTGNHGDFVCTEICNSCDFGAGPSIGFDCTAIGAPPAFTTPDNIEPTPAPPIPPSHSFEPSEICDSAPATSRTLTCEAGFATDWTSTWSTVRSLNSDDVHEILIPSGCLVQEERRITFNDWTGPGSQTGGVVIRTAGDARLFPPSGVRIDPSYAPVLGGFKVPANRSRFGGSGAYSSFFFAHRSSDVCFQNIKFVMPAAEETNYFTRIEGVSGSGNHILDLRDPLPPFVHDTDDLVVDFDDCDGLQGLKDAANADAGTKQIAIYGGPYSPSGPCQSGRAAFFTAAKIASIESTPAVRINFTGEHGFYDLEELEVESIDDNGDGTSTLNLVRDMHRTRGQHLYVQSEDVVRISDSGTVLDGQMLVVESSTARTIKISGSASCLVACGKVREHHALVVTKSDLPELDGAHHYRKVDLDTVELLDAFVSRPGGSGGHAMHAGGALASMFFLNSQQERIAFDRVFVDCGQLPFRSRNCIAAGGMVGLSIANSFFIGPKHPFVIDPVSKKIRDSTTSPSNSVAIFLGYNGARDIQVRNTVVADTHGIVFAGDSSCESRVSDVTFHRVVADKPNSFIAGHSESDGMYYNDRHSFELKCGERVLLDGYYAGGSWADGTPSAAALMFRALGGGSLSEPFATRDIDIKGLHIARSSSGVQILQGAVYNRAPPIQRVSIVDSLFEELDYFQYASQPAQITGAKKGNCCNFAGFWIFLAGDQSDIRIANNTLGHHRCRGIGCLLDIGAGFKNRLVFKDNIAPFSRSFAFGVNTEDNGKNAFVPSCEGKGSGRGYWDCLVHEILPGGQHQTDPNSAIRDSVFFGGLENMFVSKSTYDAQSLSTSDSVSVSSSETEAYFDGWTTGNFYPTSQTMAGRMNEVFMPDSWVSKIAEKGFSERRFMAHRGLIGTVNFAWLSATHARVSYQAPENSELQPESCWVDYSSDPLFSDMWWTSGGRIPDSGLPGPRSVDLTNLAEDGVYYWRLLCPGTQARGQFRSGIH